MYLTYSPFEGPDFGGALFGIPGNYVRNGDRVVFNKVHLIAQTLTLSVTLTSQINYAQNSGTKRPEPFEVKSALDRLGHWLWFGVIERARKTC